MQMTNIKFLREQNQKLLILDVGRVNSSPFIFIYIAPIHNICHLRALHIV